MRLSAINPEHYEIRYNEKSLAWEARNKYHFLLLDFQSPEYLKILNLLKSVFHTCPGYRTWTNVQWMLNQQWYPSAKIKGYHCSNCKINDVQLWREYQVCYTDLFCFKCALKNQRKQESDIKSVEIGWLVPAIPIPSGIGYWGYSSIPESGCRWWYNLPGNGKQIEAKDRARYYYLSTENYLAYLHERFESETKFEHLRSLFREIYLDEVARTKFFERDMTLSGCFKVLDRIFPDKDAALIWAQHRLGNSVIDYRY